MLRCAAGVFPRGPGQVMKLRVQIKQYVAGQLAACTEPDPAHPDKPFRASSEWSLCIESDASLVSVRLVCTINRSLVSEGLADAGHDAAVHLEHCL